MHKKSSNIMLLLSILAMLSCASTPTEAEKPTETEKITKSESKNENIIKSFSLTSKAPIYRGSTLEFKYHLNEEVDSAQLVFNEHLSSVDLKSNKIAITPTSDFVGSTRATLNVYKDGKKSTKNTSFRVLPKESPQEYGITVKNTLPHSTSAYTQGLEFYNDNLYESSGEYGVSYLEIKEFPSLKSIKKKYLDPKYFAEGLTVLNDKLYLLTWKENKAFRVNPQTLEIEKEFYVGTEGWGLTTDGKVLYMSDGTDKIYIVSPDDFSIKSHIEVITNEGTINSINEMEWINGEIWANVYGYDVILIISPKTGEVKGIIRTSNLLSPSDIKPNTDVLNGIAYDKKSGKTYITGKNWPKMFEIVKIEQ